MATRSSILAWKIPWTEEPHMLYSPWGLKELDRIEHTHRHTHVSILQLLADPSSKLGEEFHSKIKSWQFITVN